MSILHRLLNTNLFECLAKMFSYYNPLLFKARQLYRGKARAKESLIRQKVMLVVISLLK